MGELFHFTAETPGDRLDVFLTEHLEGTSRSMAQKLLEEERTLEQ